MVCRGLQHPHDRLLQGEVRGLSGDTLPGGGQRVFEQRHVRRFVDEKDDPIQRHPSDQLLDLEDAAAVAGGEPAQVHEHGIGVARQTGHRHPPGVVMAEEILDGKKAVGGGVAVFDEGAAEATAEENVELVRLDGRVGEIGTGDQPDRTQIAPALPEIVEQPLGATIESEHPEVEQRPRRRCGAKLAEEA